MINEYWKICVEESLDEIGIKSTEDQREKLTVAMADAAEMESETTGRLCIPNPLERELADTKRELEIERDKVHCQRCNGRGRTICDDGIRSSESQCWECHGEGKRKL